MSEIVDEDRGLLAAEFILGTLDAHERARATELLESDQQFGELLAIWEHRLGELHLMVEPVEPNPEIWGRVWRRVLPGAPPLTEAPPIVEAPQPTEAPPATETHEAPEAVPEPAAANQPPEPFPEDQKPSEPEQPPQLEVVEAAPPTDPEPVEPQPDLASAQFAAVEAALQAAARRAEPAREAARPEPLAPEPPPQPALPKEPNLPPKHVVVHDLRRQRELAAPDDKHFRLATRRGGDAWRALGPLMTLIAAALAGLIVAWRYVPDRLPSQLQPSVLLNMAPAPANADRRPPGRVTSQFQE
jgi:hypothetical protein